MRQNIQHDASDALEAANLGCRCVAIQGYGVVRLRVETTRWGDAERVLADVGLVLVDVCHGGDAMTLARIVRAKVSKR